MGARLKKSVPGHDGNRALRRSVTAKLARESAKIGAFAQWQGGAGDICATVTRK
jgi:hypothetical protein